MTSRPPHHRTSGSASGGSWQSRRIEQHSFSATLVRGPAPPFGFNAHLRPAMVVLPVKFSPSRVVSPSGFFVAGSLLPVLWPLLTSAPSRRSSRTAAPSVAGVLGAQISLSKNVNSCCATGPFISGTKHWAALCGASSPVPSTLYGLSVRRLISFDRWLPSHGASRLRSCFGLMFGSSCPSL